MLAKLRARPAWYLVAGLAVLAAMVAAPAKPASAATYTVTKTEDTADGACDADCSLREAIIAANGIPGADTITLPADTYTLTIPGIGESAAATGDLDITDDLTINGAGAASTVIDGGAIDRVFTIDPNGSGIAAEISGVTVQNGNTATNGSGIFNAGTLTLTGVTISGNTAAYSGGGIYNYDSTLTLTNSTVGGNAAAVDGGGIYNWGGTLTLTNSAVSGNTAVDDAGGVYNEGTATLAMTNVTVSDNTATGSGGGILTVATAALTNVTVSGNTAPYGAGIYNFGGTATLTNSIVANGISGGDCYGTITSGGHNLDSDGTCGLTGTGDISNTGPMLGPLADNGGPTKTHALLIGSPAIDAGDDGACPATDQRGVARPQGASCDIGAFEWVLLVGDVDCNGTVNSVDALKLLRYVAGLTVSQQPGCPPIGTGDPVFGDVDCNGAANSVDALKVLRYVAGLTVSQTEPCPDVGTPP